MLLVGYEVCNHCVMVLKGLVQTHKQRVPNCAEVGKLCSPDEEYREGV